MQTALKNKLNVIFSYDVSCYKQNLTLMFLFQQSLDYMAFFED